MTVDDGNLITKDPDEHLPIAFDWDDELTASAVIINSTWVIEPVKPSTTDSTLLLDDAAIDIDQRGTTMRLLAGTVGQWYKVTNRVETNESTLPSEDRWVYILIQ